MARLRIVALALMLLPLRVQADPDARFEPPSTVDAAQARYLRGKKLFQAKQYAAAADEFSAAYGLDPQAKFLLFNLGVARRMAGSCQAAIDAYRAFLDAEPPAELGDNAKIGIERCEAIVASLPPPPDEPPKETKVAPIEPPKVQPVYIEDPREPWYRDSVGDVLTGGGAAVAIASATLYILARRDADATHHPTSLTDFENSRTSASELQTASLITGAASAALVIAGVIHYSTRPRPRHLAVAPLHGGAGISIGGAF